MGIDTLIDSFCFTVAAEELSEPYVFSDSVRQTACLRGFGELYENNEMFDLTIKVEGQEFECHRAFLAASSDYFRAMLTTNMAEKQQNVITMSGMDATSMRLIMKYLYTASVELTTNTVQNLLSAANLLQLKDLKDGCADFMSKKLDTDNCIGIHFFAQAHECETLEFSAWDVITENFECVSESNEFVELSPENVIEIIKYDDIHASEEEVFEATSRWLAHASDARSPHIFSVFSNIRFLLIDQYFFFDRAKNNTLLQGCPQTQQLLDEVVRYKMLNSRWMESDLRLEPRYGADKCRVIVFTSYTQDDKKQVLLSCDDRKLTCISDSLYSSYFAGAADLRATQ